MTETKPKKRQTRQTKQKDIVSRAIASQKGFFSAEALYDTIKTDNPEIGLATIYRFLKVVVKSGELHTYTCDRRQVYAKHDQHCHFVDERSGKVVHFSVDSLDFLKNKIKGKINSFSIEVRGELE